MKCYLVYHNDEQSRLIKDVHVAVFKSRKDAEEFIKMRQEPDEVGISLNILRKRYYNIAEIDFVDEKDWAYWKKQQVVE